eukprot:TRINITY_DN103985_c0_g1_i1.p1 TRINITY_DN103985_c0_g1~~TRINITY_DN103985_c0_g1_i1.p1  ORF type:complete len:364 (-),score=81.27 TRINITY_DN103985_c0_g1_i1:129-1220(-)
MGNSTSCCTSDVQAGAGYSDAAIEPSTVLDDSLKATSVLPVAGGPPETRTYKVKLNKSDGGKLGLDVDYMAERRVLPIMGITGGLSQKWNDENANMQMNKGDSIMTVNEVTGNVSLMLEKCKTEQVLELTLIRAMTYDYLVADIEKLLEERSCGPALIRLSWQDNISGCPNAALRHDVGGEGYDPHVMALLKPISDKYCPLLLSHADLWALAANIAIRIMGGPEIPARFGRVDAEQGSAVARLDGNKSAVDNLRAIFKKPGFDEKHIVSLAGALAVANQQSAAFDNSYYKGLASKGSSTASSKPQFATTAHIQMLYDAALVEDNELKRFAQKYTEDSKVWTADFTQAWSAFQEVGASDLRDIL